MYSEEKSSLQNWKELQGLLGWPFLDVDRVWTTCNQLMLNKCLDDSTGAAVSSRGL
jgi:hypothetical protein